MDKPLKILIVDDSHVIRTMLKNALMHSGFVALADFDEAQNGSNALHVLTRDIFHLVISGWDMPKMDGLELLAQMRANSRFAHIPFIMVSSATEVEKVKEAIKSGIDEYITKPIKPDDFARRVKAVLIKKELLQK